MSRHLYHPHLMKIEVSPGVFLSVRSIGEGPRTALLLHGWMVSGTLFDPLLHELDTPGWTFLVPDLRGAGDSDDASSYTIEDYVADVLVVLDTLDLREVTLVGHSMGGLIGQVVAARCPDRIERLVLINPVPLGGIELPEEIFALFRASATDADKRVAVLELACIAQDGRQHLMDSAATVSASAIVESLNAFTAGGFESCGPLVQAKTSVIATSDPFLPPAFLQEAVVDRIANASLHILEGPGHYGIVEDPKRSARLLETLLA